MSYFEGIDLAQFWEESDYARRAYVLPPPSDTVIESVQNRLGFRLPAAYVELMRSQKWRSAEEDGLSHGAANVLGRRSRCDSWNTGYRRLKESFLCAVSSEAIS